MADRILITATREDRVVQQYAAGRAGATSIGRHGTCDIVLDSLEVSRIHAEIRFEDGAFRIHDLGSSNSVFVNGERVNATALEDGDVVRIGDCELHVSIPSGDAAEDSRRETADITTIRVDPQN